MSATNAKRFERAILATSCIPWNADGTVNRKAFEDHITDIVTNCTRYVYVFGTAGEGYAVSDGQFHEIVDVFTSRMDELGAVPMVGVISLSMVTIVERIAYAVERGVRHFQLSLPSWGTCTVDEAKRFFVETCGRFEECKFLHYNTPRSGRTITPAEYGELAEAHTNLVATKNSGDSVVAVSELHRYAPSLRHFLTEYPLAIASFLGLDAGFLISRSCINWDHAKRYYQACLDRDVTTIASYIDQFITMGEAFKKVVIPKSHMDGGYDKLFPMFHQADFAPELLPPYGTTDRESFVQLRDFLKKELPDWVAE